MGVPAPKFISYGSLDSSYHFSSILMTRLPGKPLDSLPDTEIDYDAIKEDMIRILTRMRSYASPWGKRVCGVAGGPICGPMIPGCPMPACEDEIAFQDSIRYITGFSGRTGRDAEHVRKGEEFFALPKHAIVFTHGDLNYHNIMVGSDGHICGIFDWEAAGWLPEYWEISVTAILPTRNWGRFMDKEVSLGFTRPRYKGIEPYSH
ncbi:hypothetical protein VNI00_007420 [Paramarasmius palmivorus]|uniref:Aminoglycoside phosphotransferase domain-containing protein n=1 Tax=Paramarasmius palmivorus TaxID=297713 RepID=A0AAW0D410_9AGAR